MRDRASETLAGNITDELTRIRKELGISHEKLAAKSGLSRSAISYTESRKRNPTLLSCLRIARGLGVRLSDVMSKLEK